MIQQGNNTYIIFVLGITTSPVPFMTAAVIATVAMVTASSSVAVVNLLPRGTLSSWNKNMEIQNFHYLTLQTLQRERFKQTKNQSNFAKQWG